MNDNVIHIASRRSPQQIHEHNYAKLAGITEQALEIFAWTWATKGFVYGLITGLLIGAILHNIVTS